MPKRRTVLKCWYRSDNKFVLTDEACNAVEVHAKQPLLVRLWRVSGVIKPWHGYRDVLRTCEIQCAPAGNVKRVVKPSKQRGNTMAYWKSDQFIVVGERESRSHGEGADSYITACNRHTGRTK